MRKRSALKNILLDYTRALTILLGFYLPRPSLSDFIVYEELTYTNTQQYTWLGIGGACMPGVEAFKRKWRAIPRFDIWTYEYVVDHDPVDSNAHCSLSPLSL